MAKRSGLDAVNLFHSLLLSSAFEPLSGLVLDKWDILSKFIENDLAGLSQRFDSNGRGRDESERELSGFGFLVEAFARYSSRLPVNTQKADFGSQLILKTLHDGKDELVSLERSLSNSDFIWLNYIGRRMTVTAIGEVKASYEAYKERKRQLAKQEKTLRNLAELINNGKATHDFFLKRKLVVADELRKILIVPYGQKKRFGNDKPEGWEILELEFSRDELMFIAQKIWPGYRTDITFKPGILTNLERVIEKFEKWVKDPLSKLFPDAGFPVAHRELGLFIFATYKMPVSDEQIKWAIEVSDSAYWPALQRLLIQPPTPNLSLIERSFFDKFLYLLTSDAVSLSFFLDFCRSLEFEIKERTKAEDAKRFLSSFEDINIANLIPIDHQ